MSICIVSGQGANRRRMLCTPRFPEPDEGWIGFAYQAFDILECRSRVEHITIPNPLDARHEAVFPKQPVGFPHRLAFDTLLHHHSKRV